ncbi:unnamed protein product [Spodoptera littoralis]|uniref:Uncharacterized protein n=1 Tax=Spodoptera littoralis TaxID=7109 RepID=A0A9P0HVC5_SPOLI|nr:unnamed protein product [Spodoptera littoralis]CAH1636038.1 unnamed protein product [Spodoptera littoralis]
MRVKSQVDNSLNDIAFNVVKNLLAIVVSRQEPENRCLDCYNGCSSRQRERCGGIPGEWCGVRGSYWRAVCQTGCRGGVRCSVSDRSGVACSDHGSSSDWSSCETSWRRHNGSCSYQRFFAHHRVETVHGVSCVVNYSASAIRVHQRVLTLHQVSIALLALTLVVSGERVSHVVSEIVLWEGVELLKPGSDRGSSDDGLRDKRSSHSWNHTGAGHSHHACEDDELKGHFC